MTELLENCPLCNSGQFTFAIRPKDYTVSQETFSIQQCTHCGLRFTNPRPSKERLASYYESSEYISHTNSKSSPLELVYQLVRTYTLRQKEKLARHWTHNPVNILDVGCGTGQFLAQCKAKGWQIDGVEINDKARVEAATLVQQDLYATLAALPKERTYACISLWHVLEHVYDLQETLKELQEKLAPKGTILLALPNPEAYDAALYQEHWAAYDVPRHLYHFNQQSIRFLAEQQQLRLQAVLPMKFDAYYVSLLSEKYANKKMNWYKAMRNGWKANRWAKKHQENYSSLIYILEKE